MNQQQPNQHPLQQPPKKRGVGKIVGIGCAGVFGLFVLIGALGAAVSGGSDGSGGGNGGGKVGAAQEARGTSSDSKPEVEAQVPVTLSAEKAAFVKSLLADGTEHTSVLVTVANSGDQEVDVNPLYFAITDTNGTKHAAELAADENQIDTVKLAPGENISGSVTGKGSFTPKHVTFTDGFLGDPIRADVS